MYVYYSRHSPLYLSTPIWYNICQKQYVMTTPVTFLSEVYTELRKVTWPTRQEIVRLTATVILVSVIVGVFIGGLDFVFTSLLQAVVK